MSIELPKLIKFIVEEFDGELINNSQEDTLILGFSPINKSKSKTASWMRKQDIDWKKLSSSLIIGQKGLILDREVRQSVVLVDNPRLVFAKVMKKYFENRIMEGIHPTAIVHEESFIEDHVSIGPYCVIKKNVSIKSGSHLESNVIIEEGVSIGNNTSIKSGTVIGQDGFAVERDENQALIKIPHHASVLIGSNVDIGSLNTINRGTLEDTIICDGVKTDDHVHIAHNCYIGENVVMTPGVTLCGSVIIKKNSWLGAQSTIIEGTTINEGTLIGIGAVVIRDTQPNSTYVGNPAKRIK